MNKQLKFIIALFLAGNCLSLKVLSAESEHHHNHGASFANFIPGKILNPDDSEYETPEEIAEHVGLYAAETAIAELDVDLKLLLTIQEDGLFNLAYYFENEPETTGQSFYVNEAGKLESTPAIYQDLTLMTGALREIDGGLGSGLIRETLAPIVLLDEAGQPDALYTYKTMAYGLRENYQNARVYQSVGLYITDGAVVVDVPHLLGLDSNEPLLVQFEQVDQDADEFLVATPTFELLQHNFDTYLEDHNDFLMAFDTPNDFIQKVLAMHLETNTSFPQDTKVELVKATLTNADATYALLINDALLYAYDGKALHLATEFRQTDTGHYRAKEWTTN